MTDHSERLRDRVAKRTADLEKQATRGWHATVEEAASFATMTVDYNDVVALLDALSSQSLSLSEARAENDRKDLEIERLKGLVAGIRECPQEPPGIPRVGSQSIFDALEAAYIRGASWCAELGGKHTFGELRKAAFDYADKEQPDLLAANTAPGAVLEAVLAAYEAETRSLPLGAANREKGDSTYNWRMSVIRDLRELASRLTNTSLER